MIANKMPTYAVLDDDYILRIIKPNKKKMRGKTVFTVSKIGHHWEVNGTHKISTKGSTKVI